MTVWVMESLVNKDGIYAAERMGMEGIGMFETCLRSLRWAERMEMEG